jgi:PHP family Zn ribbon phosphoesterase
MLREFKVDLHIHTTLSPCGDSNMIPPLVVDQARKKGLGIIGICDHNASENFLSVKKAAEGKGLEVFGGMEVTSREEAHILAVFDDIVMIKAMQDTIYQNLAGDNDVKAFGEQLVVDEYGEVVDSNPRLLMGATALSVEQVVQEIHRFGGLAIASHIDREMFSVAGQLGFVPQGVDFDALELSPHYRSSGKDIQSLCGGKPIPLVSFSDAHYLDDIGKSFTRIIMAKATVEDIKSALRSGDEERVVQ